MSPHLPEGTNPQPIEEIETLVAQFLAQLKAGENPDRDALVRAHPDLAGRLHARLALAELIHQVGLAPEEEVPGTGNCVEWPASAPDFHSRPTRLAKAQKEDDEAPTRPINPEDYEILGELGHGGMGVVFKARHKRLNRIVALKMIRAGAHAGPELLMRFHIEAEALAKLQHPNIVQIHEVGEYFGCPYIAMEFVDGGSLDVFIAGQVNPVRSIAELVETIARAMHVAHMRGIVHRDLKPANILMKKSDHPKDQEGILGGFGAQISDFIPKITDFGLAKHLDKSQTITGDVMGTPSYMAPEQASGRVHEIGPPTDVYSLGAILYELLIGRPPFLSHTRLDTLRQVLSEEPTAPSRLRPKLPRDLDTICLKSLEKDPSNRYPTAKDLADDLRRYLNREPIAARPASPGERLVKWVRRRPAWAALIGVVVVGSFLLVGSFAWSYFSVIHALDQKEKSLQVARKAINNLYIKMASEGLFDEPKLDPLYEEVLEEARNLYEELGHDHSDDPEIRRDIAMAWFHLGDIHRLHDQHDRAEQAYGEAITRQEELYRLDVSNARILQDLAISHNWLGDLFREGGRSLDIAESHFRAALDLQNQLVRKDANEQSYRAELARSHFNLGIVERDTNRLSEAQADYDRAIELLTKLHEEGDKSPAHRQDLARALINRGSLHRKSNRPDEARRDFDLAITLLAGLRQEVPSRAIYKFELAIALQDRGNLDWSQMLHAEAKAEHDEALAILSGLVNDYSSRPRYKKKMANSLKNLGVVMASAKDYEGAEKSLNQARDLFKALVDQFPEASDYPAHLSMTLGNLGWLKTEQKNWAEARPLIEQGIDYMKAALKPNPRQPDYLQELANQYQDLAETLVQLGDHAAAVSAAMNMANVFPDRAQETYYAACFIARCVPLARSESKATDRYAEQVAALLHKAAKGSPSVKRLSDEKRIFGALESNPEVSIALGQLGDKITPQSGNSKN